MALTVTYEWLPDPGYAGQGALTLSSDTILDPANFSSVPLSALTSISFTFTGSGLTIVDSNGTLAGGDIDSYALSPPGLSAVNGLLSSTFMFSSTRSFPTFLLQLASSGGTPSNVSLQTEDVFPPEQHVGTWRLASVAPIPLPAALPLLLSGFAAFVASRRVIRGAGERSRRLAGFRST